MNVLDLFSGIGGFSLGLERAGMRTVAFCEIEPFCRRVLTKHWPNVPCYDDVRTLSAARLVRDGITVDLICGGFPCQDISQAGKRAGIEGERSGLWKEYARLIGELRPRYVIVENVAALLTRGLDIVLRDLATLGYDAEWHCIPASAIGAPHRRDRLWLVAYPDSGWRRPDVAGGHDADGTNPGRSQADGMPGAVRQAGPARPLADTECQRIRGSGHSQDARTSGETGGEEREQRLRSDTQSGCEVVAHANGGDGHWRRSPLQMGWGRFAGEIAVNGFAGRTEWSSEPSVGRVANGIPERVDRLCGLGNAVVPQIPEIIGRAILAAEAA